MLPGGAGSRNADRRSATLGMNAVKEAGRLPNGTYSFTKDKSLATQYRNYIKIGALYEAIQDYLYKQAARGTPVKNTTGDGWRSLYVQAQKGTHPLIYPAEKKE